MIFKRMLRASLLEKALYEEVEHDRRLTGEAALVVVIVSLLPAIGFFILRPSIRSLVLTVAVGLAGWLIFALLAWLIGTKAFGGKADIGEMMRVLGYAASPLCLGIIPVVGPVIGALWTVVTAFVAIREGLDVSPLRAAITAILSVLGYAAVTAVASHFVVVP